MTTLGFRCSISKESTLKSAFFDECVIFFDIPSIFPHFFVIYAHFFAKNVVLLQPIYYAKMKLKFIKYMKSIFKKSVFLLSFIAAGVMAQAQVLYVVSGKCNVPLAAGMNNAKYQLFSWDGSETVVTTDIECNLNGTGGSYYNSLSLEIGDLTNVANYSTGSSSNRTMQALKLEAGKTLSVSLGGLTVSRVIAVGRANSNDALSIEILGETIETNNKDFFVVDKEDQFSGSIDIENTTGKEYNFFVYLVAGEGGETPEPEPEPEDEGEPVVTKCTFDNIVGEAEIREIDSFNGEIVAQIKFGSDRTNIVPQFEGTNLDNGWMPISADFSENATQTFSFTYANSGNVKNYELTITEAEEEDPGDDPGVDPGDANIFVVELSQFSVSDKTYEASFDDEVKALRYDYIGIEVPAIDAEGTISFNGSSNKDDRFIYICENHGTTKSESRRIVMAKNYEAALAFTAEDIFINSNKFYLVFTTTDDFKFKGVQYILGGTVDPVDPVAVESVSLSKEELTLEEGQSGTLSVNIVPSDATDKSVTWSSDDESVASVDSKGKVTAVSEGTATITVTTNDGGYTATCTVTVTKKSDTPEPPTPGDEGEIYAHWRFSGEEAPANGTFEDGTNIRVEFLSNDESKSFTVESVKYNSSVPDDMKSQGSKGLKNGGNKLYLKASTLNGQGFKAGDVITICGYNPWKISSTADHEGDISAGLTTGTGKEDYNIGSVTLSSDVSALFLMRAEGTGTCICALKVTRGGQTPPPGEDVPVTGVKLNTNSLELAEGVSEQLIATVEPSNATDQSVTWSSDDEDVAVVDSKGNVTALSEGTATITVTTNDGNYTATCEVTVNRESPPQPYVPETELTLHVPEVYEAKDVAGGYNTELSVFDGHEYEVYYINRDNSSNITISTSNVDKAGNICETGTSNTTRTKDNWAKISCNGTGGDSNASAKDEFQASVRSAKFNSDSHTMELHIQGFDQFSIYGKDNNQDASKNRMFHVFVDDIEQSRTPKDYSISRFDITTGEHVIRVTASGGSDSKLCSFSLRVAQEPRTKKLKGNDTTQVVRQTESIAPVTYVTKYNNIPGAKTELKFNGPEATGIVLEKIPGELTDTLILSGSALCPIGEYRYNVIAYLNGRETSRASGKFRVKSDIVSTSAIEVMADQGEEMDPITFKYFALSADDVTLQWTDGTPGGTVGGSGADGKYTIGGKPENVGVFPYTITVLGADTVIQGKVTVQSSDLGDNPILYLYKNTYDDGLFQYLSQRWTPKPKQALNDLREPEYYAKFKLIIISEDADANNPEVLALARGGANLPVLSLNGFSYADGRLGWGNPTNGTVDTLSNNGCNIFVERDDHPIFKGFKKDQKIQIFSKIDKKGVMPIAVTLQGSLCLATAYTRSIEDYYKDGELQTIIHEIPAKMRGGQKYICFPISRTSTSYLTADGKKLIDAILSYLTDPNASPVVRPELQINRFSLAGVEGVIDQTENTIVVEMTDKQFIAADSLRAAVPDITLADPKYSHVTPDIDAPQDFRFSFYLPVVYTLSDYISSLSYSVSVRVRNSQGIDNVYVAGEWVNIYDVYGRKVATTNEDIYSMSLPQGMYIVVTGTGQTLKIMR